MWVSPLLCWDYNKLLYLHSRLCFFLKTLSRHFTPGTMTTQQVASLFRLSRLLMTSPAVEPRLSVNLFPLLLFTVGPAVVLPRRIYWPLLAGTCSPFKAGACWHEGYKPSCHSFSTVRLLRLCCASLVYVNNDERSKLVCLWDDSGGGSQCWLDCRRKRSERAGPGRAVTWGLLEPRSEPFRCI